MPSRWVKWLKIYFVFGAVIDGLATIVLLRPTLTRVLLGLEVDAGRADVLFLMGYAAALMAGWTVLLAWAACEPVGRAFVGPMTAVPVLAGLVATEAVALWRGGVDPRRVLPLLVIQIGWCVLWFLLYRAVGRPAVASVRAAPAVLPLP
ncbi:MAG: hypothetical protein HY825_20195 [Acidobacteria bacterium]|nr:hypothetical protein [Acidobacteriota bacterium]